MIAAGAIGGVFLALFKVNATSFVLQSVFAFGAFTPISYAILGSLLSLVLATVLVLIFGIGEAEPSNSPNKVKTDSKKVEVPQTHIAIQEVISSPLNGQIKALKDVDDAAFAIEAMGKGIAIVPVEGRCVLLLTVKLLPHSRPSMPLDCGLNREPSCLFM
nr:PTS glucose transporter subunit IIA [Paenibacillus sp. PCH8]